MPVPRSGLGLLRTGAGRPRPQPTVLHRRTAAQGARGRAAGRDQGQLGLDGASRDLPRLRRHQDVRLARPRHRRAPLHRPVHVEHLQHEPARDSAAAPQGAARDRPHRRVADEPRWQGADARAGDAIRATNCSSRACRSSCARRAASSTCTSASACACSRAATRTSGSSRACCTCRATATTPRPANGSSGSCSRSWRACDLESQVQISESALARLHMLVRTDPARSVAADIERIEQRITEAMRTWADQLRDELQARLPAAAADAAGGTIRGRVPGRVPGRRARRPRRSATCRNSPHWTPARRRSGMELRPGDPRQGALHLRLYRRGEPVAMSDMLPLLENFDLRILNERPYRVAPTDGSTLWIQDLEVKHAGGRTLDPEQEGAPLRAGVLRRASRPGRKRRLQPAGARRRPRLAPGADPARRLPLPAADRHPLQPALHGSGARPQSVDRAAPCLDVRIALRPRPETRNARFAGRGLRRGHRRRARKGHEPRRRPHPALVPRGDHAPTLRTNHYQRGADGQPKAYLSFKLDPKLLPELPKPRPMFEIWVYSPRVEGVHLRMGKVARGGLRWSDRREDFRTEILGLMKAQNVKNTLIVPVGAKGGFVPKQMPAGASREEVQREGTECYRIFIRGLLDLTDNVRGEQGHPAGAHRALRPGRSRTSSLRRTRAPRHSPTPPMRSPPSTASGSATRSPPAARRATTTRRWASPPRARGNASSGTSARLGMDTQSQDFTVAGIGDMAGDVFGNGMLLSPHIRLVAAFNHQHIFLDPEPDAARSFTRARAPVQPAPLVVDRLRRAPDFQGRRRVSAQCQGDRAVAAGPRAARHRRGRGRRRTEIIRAILKLPVDLLWNGGIGTYVKASREANSADRRSHQRRACASTAANCAARSSAKAATSGCSQLGRIEYALHGGRINTDFVDNSGGVDCSDHEVNIKILLERRCRRRDALTTAERNRLLAVDDGRRRRSWCCATTTCRARRSACCRRPRRSGSASTRTSSARSSSTACSTARSSTCRARRRSRTAAAPAWGSRGRSSRCC